MDKTYKHQEVEKKWYEMWEKGGYFSPKIDLKKSPFCTIMPPPNANGSLHIGHAMFLTIEDIIIRYHRMKGDPTLWLPGADHAGILTQVVFEKKLEKEEGKSRYDLGREEFVRRCMEFTLNNKRVMESQTKALGASCDWTRTCFTLDPKFNKPIYQTFKKLYDDNLLFRAQRMINWCPRCATALSDLEVIYRQQKDPLYYIKYGPLTLATVRPETKFGDTALAVHPEDKRYKDFIGKEIIAQGLLGKMKIKIIADQMVDPKFGTGVVKVTPAHDPADFEMGIRHNLEVKRVIDFNDRLNENAGKYQGLKVKQAREVIFQDLERNNLIAKVNPDYTHSVSICERCKTVVEPMVSLQWFVKMKPLAQKAIEAVREGKIKIIPKRFTKNYFIWMENIHDWCISRQIWWSHRLPVFYCGKKNLSPLQLTMNRDLQSAPDEGCGEIIVSLDTPSECPKCHGNNLIQDPDTLDTWFSSGQWPYTTLGWGQESDKNTKESSKDFKYFYPTSVMETGYEILFFWVARMIMLGIYVTGDVPFKTVFLHGLVRDAFGEKMSKSRGNVIDPLDVINKYGTDSLRMALVFGQSAGTDVKLSEGKIAAMRNFSNKLWNIGRFLSLNMEMFAKAGVKIPSINNTSNAIRHSGDPDLVEGDSRISKQDKEILSQLKILTKKVTISIDNFRFDQAVGSLYEFTWHQFADKFIEESKEELRKNNPVKLAVLIYTYRQCLVLLHPFMPFITEEISKLINPKSDKPLIITTWPK